MAVHPSEPGTYELCGPKVNGNPERFTLHRLIRHADAETIELFDLDVLPDPGVEDYVMALALLTHAGWEGIVWHHPDGRMAKLKGRDFAPVP